MSKDGFNQAAKGFDDEVVLKTLMRRGPRSILKLLANLDGRNMGEYIEKLVLQDADEQLSPETVKCCLELDGIENALK